MELSTDFTRDILKHNWESITHDLSDPETFLNMMVSRGEWLYPEEAAKLLKMSERSIRHCRQKKHIHAVKVERQYRYHPVLIQLDLLKLFYDQNFGED